jgi:serine/threonine kinase 32/serum/glucocorticoid-regulated kinase 2
MKTLSKTVILTRNHVSMVMKERNLRARLQCPQLVNMHYAFQDDRYLYIVMDVCLGGDLHFQLSNSPTKSFPENVARFYAASLILCLEYMHSVGVIHRDVKPENLLLDSRGQLKVTDMGISQELQDGVCNATSGTRPYMAPEVFMTGHKHSTVADVYSMGITIFQFLDGKRPYGNTPPNMKHIVKMAHFIPPDKFKELRQIRRILILAQERRSLPTFKDFSYSQHLMKFSPEAMDFVSCCLICNPKYRLGALGVHELMTHPWFSGIDWDAMRKQEVSEKRNSPRPAHEKLVHRHTHTSYTARQCHHNKRNLVRN